MFAFVKKLLKRKLFPPWVIFILW